MLTQKLGSTHTTRAKEEALYSRAKAFLAKVRKSPQEFDWKEWRELVGRIGKLQLIRNGEGDILAKGKSTEYLLKALALYLLDYVKRYNALPAGFYQLPEREEIMEWIKGAPDISQEDKEHLKSVYLP